jgi:methylase of polypeptide subunit release factors
MENLIKKYSTEEIEQALVQIFINNKKIKVKKNLLLLDIINQKNQNIEEIKQQVQSPKDLDELIKIFELLIPKKDRKLNGAFFTPSFITNYMADELISLPDVKVCDPSCGCGAFLVAVSENLKQKFNKKIKNIIEENIFGVDILDYSVRRCKILLSLLAALNGEDERSYGFNIYNKDSLTVDWKKLFPLIFKGGGFDVVIGNPPYVKYQDLPENLRKDLFNNWRTLKKGTYNLYFAFFELGIDILKKDGVLGYIAPNNYFTSLAGIHLREYLESNRYVDKIIDFNHLKLFKVQTYTCITFLTKTKKDYFYYKRINNYENLNNLNNIKYSKINFSDLNNRKWRLLRDTDQKNIWKIENSKYRLGELVDIRVGVATCKDSLYFIDENTFKNGYYQKEYDGSTYRIETEITKPIVKISDFKSNKEIKHNHRRIIFPYKKNSGTVTIIPEDELKNQFPECYKYLLAAKKELANRDKSKNHYPQWYAYARTQGLNFFGEKLLTPTFSSEPRFFLESNPNTLFCNGYAIYLKQKINLFAGQQTLNLKALSKILNSKIMNYYINRTSVSIEGGYPCYQKNFIEFFGIPEFTNEEIDFLQKEGDKRKIDQFLIKKYRVAI